MHIIDPKSLLIGEETVDIYINVKNFGPIEKAEIDLRPLTVFVGESNTGKTYLAALIYALHKHFDGVPQLPWAEALLLLISVLITVRETVIHKGSGRH